MARSTFEQPQLSISGQDEFEQQREQAYLQLGDAESALHYAEGMSESSRKQAIESYNKHRLAVRALTATGIELGWLDAELSEN